MKYEVKCNLMLFIKQFMIINGSYLDSRFLWPCPLEVCIVSASRTVIKNIDDT